MALTTKILFLHPIFTPQLEKESLQNKIEEKIGEKYRPVYFYNRIPSALLESQSDEEMKVFIRGMAASHAETIHPSNELVFVNPFGMMFLLDREKLYEYFQSFSNINYYEFDFLEFTYEEFLECYTNQEESNDVDEIMDAEEWEETNKELQEFIDKLNYLTTEFDANQSFH